MASETFYRCHDSSEMHKAAVFVRAASSSAIPRRPTVTELAVQPVSRDLLCSICLQVFDEPKVAVPCGHTFCGKCVEEAVSIHAACPTCNKALTPSLLCSCLNIKHMAESVRIRCVNGVSFDMASGKFTPASWDGACQLLMPLSDQQNHEKQCPHAPIGCKYEVEGCTEVKPRNRIKEHETECAFRLEICKCGAEVRGSQTHGHHLVCSAMQLDCPYKRFGCEEICARGDMLDHINTCRFGAVLHILEKQEEDRNELLATIDSLQTENSELGNRNAFLEAHFQEADQLRSRADELNMELIRWRKMVAESNAKLASSQDCVRKQNLEINALHARVAELEGWFSEIAASRVDTDRGLEGRTEKPVLELKNLLQLCPPPGLESSGPDTERWTEEERAAVETIADRAGKMQAGSSEYPFGGIQCPFSGEAYPRVERMKSLASVDCSPFVHIGEIKDSEVLSGSHSPTEAVNQANGLKQVASAWGLSSEVPGCFANCSKEEEHDQKPEARREAEAVEALDFKPVAKIERVDKVFLGSAPARRMGESIDWKDFRGGISHSGSPSQEDTKAYGSQMESGGAMPINGADDAEYHARKSAFLERLSKIEVEKGGDELELGLMALCGALESVEEGHDALPSQEQRSWQLRQRKPRKFTGGSSRQCSSDKDAEDDTYGDGDASQSRRLSKRKMEQILNEERSGKRRTGYGGIDNKSTGTDTPGQSGGSPISAGKRPDYRGGKKNPIYACTEELTDEERCIRGDGKTWRCGKRRVHDRFCENHYLQQKLKSEGGSLVTFRKAKKHNADGSSGLKKRSDDPLRKKGCGIGKGAEGNSHQGLPKLGADGLAGQTAHSAEAAGLTKAEANMQSQAPGTPIFHVYRGGKKNPLYAGKEYLKDEERCIRGDGRDWRCGHRRMVGEKFCETHFNQQKLKAERKHAKRGSSSDGGRKAGSKGSEDEDTAKTLKTTSMPRTPGAPSRRCSFTGGHDDWRCKVQASFRLWEI